jgi:hypothetical protein
VTAACAVSVCALGGIVLLSPTTTPHHAAHGSSPRAGTAQSGAAGSRHAAPSGLTHRAAANSPAAPLPAGATQLGAAGTAPGAAQAQRAAARVSTPSIAAGGHFQVPQPAHSPPPATTNPPPPTPTTSTPPANPPAATTTPWPTWPSKTIWSGGTGTTTGTSTHWSTTNGDHACWSWSGGGSGGSGSPWTGWHPSTDGTKSPTVPGNSSACTQASTASNGGPSAPDRGASRLRDGPRQTGDSSNPSGL